MYESLLLGYGEGRRGLRLPSKEVDEVREPQERKHERQHDPEDFELGGVQDGTSPFDCWAKTVISGKCSTRRDSLSWNRRIRFCNFIR